MKAKKSPFCNCLLFSANALSRVINRMAEEEFALVGLAPSHAFILMAVSKNPGMQPCEISEFTLLAPSTITRLVEKMEAKDLVERTVEGKCTYLYPTRKGLNMEKKVRDSWNRISDRCYEKLGEDRSKNISDMMFEAAEKLE